LSLLRRQKLDTLRRRWSDLIVFERKDHRFGDPLDTSGLHPFLVGVEIRILRTIVYIPIAAYELDPHDLVHARIVEKLVVLPARMLLGMRPWGQTTNSQHATKLLLDKRVVGFDDGQLQMHAVSM